MFTPAEDFHKYINKPILIRIVNSNFAYSEPDKNFLKGKEGILIKGNIWSSEKYSFSEFSTINGEYLECFVFKVSETDPTYQEMDSFIINNKLVRIIEYNNINANIETIIL